MISRIKVALAVVMGITLADSAFPNPWFFWIPEIIDSLSKNGMEGEATLFCHPADGNEDWQLVMDEAIAYLAGWQGGSNPLAYAIRAAYLWQNGDLYHYDAAEDPPLCWGPGPAAEEGEVPIEGESAEGEGEMSVEGEGEIPPEGEGEMSVEGDGEIPLEGESSTETIMLPGDVPLEMVWIPGGTFQMGRYPGELDSIFFEDPQHTVTVPGFWMGKYEVTKAQWTAIMGTTPWSGAWGVLDHPDSPAVYVSRNDAQGLFIPALNTHTGQAFRLPSEAEWEYACRAGTTTRFYWGDDPSYSAISDYEWWVGNASDVGEQYAHVVGLKLPNGFGLFDMSGNVREWCEDIWHYDYNGAPNDGSAWEDVPWGDRVIRSGGWGSSGTVCRSAHRWYDNPADKIYSIGFRLAR